MTTPASDSPPGAVAATRLLREGKLTVQALVEGCLARIEARDPSLHAFTAVDPEAALRHAAEADRKGPSGPLWGLPFAVKDVLDTADLPSAYGSPIWQGHRPRADAAAVAAARGAGGILLGKTVTTEFATRHPGPTVNPINPLHTPGGSSSGSAAAVAAGLVPFAFGTQTAGSIIRPASFCGITGYKPSFGWLHRAGMKVMSESLDTIGVLARSVEDCALFVSALTGRDLEDDGALGARPPRLAVLAHPPGAKVAPDALEVFGATVEALGRAGAILDSIALPEICIRANEVHSIVMNMEVRQALTWELTTARDSLSPVLRENTDVAGTHPPSRLDAGRQVFAEARAAFAALLQGFDGLLTLSAPGEAPEGLGWTGDPSCNALWTALHGPCVTVPAGTGVKGLPIGVQVVAPVGQDRRALACADWVRRNLA
ncbi:amidase [Roseomonas xinghualingensis]|uniref:amidase n=1 Tax=Roseomonas xinghualingensis TaxID=2986475 RepID=UPI0021F2155D|nr:amidase [Roseomonas sp. SXEYE001]MCV4207224.1 amidase [Roseomonas sp. SXEYE001]